MKKLYMLLALLFVSGAYAENKITVTIKELNNLANSTALEVCGEAHHSDGKRPLLVTLTHDESKYTTLTSEDGKWCAVIKRWTFNGNVSAVSSTLDYLDRSLNTMNLDFDKVKQLNVNNKYLREEFKCLKN